ncbi:MAG: nucleoside deaminase [Streptosporangiaceae bacterium]
MPGKLDDTDRRYLQRAIEISRHALEDGGKTPFGALVVVAGQVAGEGTSQVVERRDPTAHAEIMALRAAGEALGRHILEDGVMYASSEPCPMCLTACYWARIPRVVYGATSHDVATYGFEDLQFYREIGRRSDERLIQEDAAGDELREAAAAGLRAWAERLPSPVEPKY